MVGCGCGKRKAPWATASRITISCARFHWCVTTVKASEIPFTIEMSTDVTEIKMLEKEKLEAERLAAVGETVAGLAHGIKNVLMGLEGGVYIVRTGMKNADSNRILRGWGVVEENIERISAFVKEFLDFAKGRTAKVEAVDPNLIATKVIELFWDSARLVGIELTCDLASGIESANLDEEGIHACLVNLVSNALDACEMSDKRGGHVHVSTADRGMGRCCSRWPTTARAWIRRSGRRFSRSSFRQRAPRGARVWDC